jgi:hypothetical protein
MHCIFFHLEDVLRDVETALPPMTFTAPTPPALPLSINGLLFLLSLQVLKIL